jgi:hypothetical protein
MSRLVFDRIVVRANGKGLGPLTASLGAGMHGIEAESLADTLELLDRVAVRRGGYEGKLTLEPAERSILYLGDLLPFPKGYTAETLGKMLVGERGERACIAAGIEPTQRVDRLANHEALRFVVRLCLEMEGVGAVLVPPPHTLVAAHEEREAARHLRTLAAAGIPVVVFIAPGSCASRWVDDLLFLDEAGRVRGPAAVASFDRRAPALRVRGESLEKLASAVMRPGIELTLHASGNELVLRSERPLELERALTEAIATTGTIVDEVTPWP